MRKAIVELISNSIFSRVPEQKFETPKTTLQMLEPSEEPYVVVTLPSTPELSVPSEKTQENPDTTITSDIRIFDETREGYSANASGTLFFKTPTEQPTGNFNHLSFTN